MVPSLSLVRACDWCAWWKSWVWNPSGNVVMCSLQNKRVYVLHDRAYRLSRHRFSSCFGPKISIIPMLKSSAGDGHVVNRITSDVCGDEDGASNWGLMGNSTRLEDWITFGQCWYSGWENKGTDFTANVWNDEHLLEISDWCHCFYQFMLSLHFA